ncbi:MAG: cell filamentation protein Fic [Methylocystaceae bacterium]|nr:MAG: cell filamentation protein Fic [Methylocystaceae bacterium]
MSDERHSQADPVELIRDPEKKARREAENGVRQFNSALQIIRDHIPNHDGAFRLRQAAILKLHREALDGIHPLAGTYRNSRVFIGKSNHLPPSFLEVPDHVADVCDYVNRNWNEKNAVHLAAYVLWRLNWIHPFADGNGRTARIVSYVILNIKLNSLLPGAPTIPDQIAADKAPYYSALEKADEAWRFEKVDLSAMEAMLERMLAEQLLRATEEAAI